MSLIGTKVAELDTPSLVVDLDILEKNITRMAEYCKRHGLQLRPHIKTHKIAEIAQMQMQAGACGVTVAKVSEAEVMVQAGIFDILVAYPVIGAFKTQRLAQLAKRAKMTVAIDSIEAAQGLHNAAREAGVQIQILLDRDVGFGRTGFSSDTELTDCALKMGELPNLTLKGLFCFPGQILESPNEQETSMAQIQRILSNSKQALEALGFEVSTVSSGSTPTAYQTHLTPVVTEVRPGTYVFNDSNYLAAEAHSLGDCALSVHTLVVSRAVKGQVVIDGGSKTFSSDARHVPTQAKSALQTYGTVLDLDGAQFIRCSEEHGWIDVSACQSAPKVGDRLRVIPNHVCPAVNLHDRIYGARGGRIEAVWAVAARGKVQ